MREAAVAHLAEHVLRERLPAHLRTCGCRTAGCAWHPGRRGCGGQIALVLFCGLSRRSWYLADACETCADAIPQAARIPQAPDLGASPALAAGPVRRRRRGGEAFTVAGQRLAVRAALARVTVLPPVGAEARLLAVVCALRARRSGLSPLPHGLVRSLRLARPALALAELQDAGWLHYLSRPRGGPAVFIPDLAAHRCGRAGRWALQLLSDPRMACLAPTDRLAALAVLAWAEQPGEPFLVEAEAAARAAGLSLRGFGAAVARARSAGALSTCEALPSGLLTCWPARR
ncbi:hypothetical protein [Kitasatospora phosalacinea]|uniref:hypothetical protein n=1 Tax=Kitasatospora phosalacinea TaxID=2065 RepID=UPI00068D9059|nr:hypothetical protein [Kitasatospora phosalacinea]